MEIQNKVEIQKKQKRDLIAADRRGLALYHVNLFYGILSLYHANESLKSNHKLTTIRNSNFLNNVDSLSQIIGLMPAVGVIGNVASIATILAKKIEKDNIKTSFSHVENLTPKHDEIDLAKHDEIDLAKQNFDYWHYFAKELATELTIKKYEEIREIRKINDAKNERKPETFYDKAKKKAKKIFGFGKEEDPVVKLAINDCSEAISLILSGSLDKGKYSEKDAAKTAEEYNKKNAAEKADVLVNQVVEVENSKKPSNFFKILSSSQLVTQPQKPHNFT